MQVRELTVGEIKAMSHEEELQLTLLEKTLRQEDTHDMKQKQAANTWPSEDVIVPLNDLNNDKLPVYVVYDEGNVTSSVMLCAFTIYCILF